MDQFTVLMEHEVTVYGPSLVTSGTAGGDVITWPTTRQAGVECVLNASPAAEQERFAQMGLIGSVAGATLYTGLTRGDKLLVTAGPSLVGKYLHVTAVKRQPGVDFLGIDEVIHFTGEFQE